MGQLLVRDLDEHVIQQLKRRGAANGRSTEAEHRAILEAAVPRMPEPPSVTAQLFVAELAAAPGPTGAELIREARDLRASRS